MCSSLSTRNAVGLLLDLARVCLDWEKRLLHSYKNRVENMVHVIGAAMEHIGAHRAAGALQ